MDVDISIKVRKDREMKQILFRAKQRGTGDWVEGVPIQHSDGDWQIHGGFSNAGFLAVIHPETVCQYTGLTDKNDKKIFEGDILSAHLDDEHPEDTTYVQITWNGFSWCTRESTEDDVISESDCKTFEVCGNIFDNPELIGNEMRI